MIHRDKVSVFVCCKEPIRDERMSLAARGLYALICACEENGEGTEDLESLKEVEELIEFGYIVIKEYD